MAGVAVMHCPLPFANALPAALSLLPASDRTWFSESSTISDMRAWSAAKADEHHRFTRAFHAIQNILAPIHRLPPDILSRIFVEAWHDRRSLRLTHVCRIWRSILLDTSEFWAVTIAGDKFRLPSDEREVSDEAYLDAACLRSAPRNISLHLSTISPRGHLQLIQHADRITSMQISAAHTRDQLELLWKILHAGMPRLEHLAVRASATIGIAKLTTKELPLLTRLTLPARLFCGSWPSTLQEISFQSGRGDAGSASLFVVSLDRLLWSLDDYPNLRVLDIRDDKLFHDPRSFPPSRAFPTLELLRIRSRRRTVSAILSLLNFPPSTRVDVGIVCRERHPQGDLEIFVPGRALDGVVALIDQVTIRSGLTSTIHGHTGGAERFRFTISSREWGPPVEAISLLARTHRPVSRLLVAQHPGAAHRMPVAFAGSTIFSAFPHLTHLTLYARRSVCEELLEALHLLHPPSLPLPLLRDLTVGFATRRRSEISKALRRGDVVHMRYDGIVVIHFRECCMTFPCIFQSRADHGSRLSRLEFFSYEEGCMTRPASDPAVSHVDLAALDADLVDREIEPLQGFVDGPVVFSGYRFFTQG